MNFIYHQGAISTNFSNHAHTLKDTCCFPGELWTSADMVDCILAYAATVLVDKMTDPKSAEGREMLDLVKADARASKQILLLAHLCASSLTCMSAWCFIGAISPGVHLHI